MPIPTVFGANCNGCNFVLELLTYVMHIIVSEVSEWNLKSAWIYVPCMYDLQVMLYVKQVQSDSVLLSRVYTKDLLIFLNRMVCGILLCPVKIFIFMPRAWKVRQGHLVNGSSVRLSICPFVRNSVPLTNKVQYFKFGWWYSYQTSTVSSSMDCSHFTDITCPWGWQCFWKVPVLSVLLIKISNVWQKSKSCQSECLIQKYKMFYTEQELVWQKITRSGIMYLSVRPNVWQVWKVFKKSGMGWGQNVGLGDFCHILTLLPLRASVFLKYMSSF